MKEKANKKPILVPVDFSSHAEAALVHAAKIADCLEVTVIVLHVVHDPGTMPGYYARASKKKFLVHIEDAAREMLDEFLAAARHKEPELKALKAQIDPHFLFNSLNSIYSLVLKKSDLAPEALIKLADAMRYIIYESNEEKVSLQKEIDFPFVRIFFVSVLIV